MWSSGPTVDPHTPDTCFAGPINDFPNLSIASCNRARSTQSTIGAHKILDYAIVGHRQSPACQQWQMVLSSTPSQHSTYSPITSTEKLELYTNTLDARTPNWAKVHRKTANKEGHCYNRRNIVQSRQMDQHHRPGSIADRTPAVPRRKPPSYDYTAAH